MRCRQIRVNKTASAVTSNTLPTTDMAPILITGGNGFIGSVVVRKLVESGRDVRCLLRKTSKTSRIDGLPFERADGDVRDSAAVGAAIAGCEAAIHLAGIVNWSHMDTREMNEVVVGGTKTVLDVAEAARCRKVVYVSSTLAVCGSPRPHVFDEAGDKQGSAEKLSRAKAKREAEKLCRQAVTRGLHVVIVNPAEVYGPNDSALVTAGNLIEFALQSPVFVCAGGTGVVHVDDVADGIIAALDRGRVGERYILSGENLTVRQLAQLTIELLGQRKTIVTPPRWLVRGLAWGGRILHVPVPFNPEVIPYATRYWFVDNAKARRELGVSFRGARETLQATTDWLRHAGYVR